MTHYFSLILMLNLQFEIEGEVQFNRTFTRFTENLTDLRQLWPGVIGELREISREQFAGQGVGPSGNWDALSPKYAAWKARRYPGKPILQREGKLLAALTGNTSDSIVDAKPTYLEFGTRRRGARYHQKGGGKLPKRKIFDLNERQKARLMKVIQKRLLQAGRDAGFTLG